MDRSGLHLMQYKGQSTEVVDFQCRLGAHRSALLHVLTKKKGVKISDLEEVAYPLLGLETARKQQKGAKGKKGVKCGDDERPKKTKAAAAAADEERPKKRKKKKEDA